MGKTTVVVDRCGHVERPLARLVAAVNSSLEFEVAGVDEGFENLCVHIGRPGSVTHVPATSKPLPDGRWRVYLNGLYFPVAGAAEYHLTATDRFGGKKWLGKGELSIIPSVLESDGELPVPIVPEDTYLRNPVTGLWHKLIVEVEDGELVPAIEKKGVER